MRYANADLHHYVIEKTCEIQQIPAPTFAETKRSEYLFNEFTRLGLKDVSQDETGNVYASWPGSGEGCLVVSAHLDTVHSGDTPLALKRSRERITGPGVGDNSLGVATLLGIGRYLADTRADLGGRIWLVGDVCEEGLGNLAGMQAVVQRFGEQAVAYLILEGLGLGQICHRGLGVLRYRVTVETTGGHPWSNYGMPSAIHELVAVLSAVTALPIPRKPRTSLNVGVIQGGASVNTIASKAWFELDLRSEDHMTLTLLANRIKRVVKKQVRPGVGLIVEPIGSRPAGEIEPSHPLVKLAVDVLAELNIKANLEIGSTDANYALSKGYPAICLGITNGRFSHTLKEYIEVAPVKTGLEQILQILHRVWEALG
jgi:acetylornithine deacetylase/succinyl-diaminopimelate desuccinylase-like protein